MRPKLIVPIDRIRTKWIIRFSRPPRNTTIVVFVLKEGSPCGETFEVVGTWYNKYMVLILYGVWIALEYFDEVFASIFLTCFVMLISRDT